MSIEKMLIIPELWKTKSCVGTEHNRNSILQVLLIYCLYKLHFMTKDSIDKTAIGLKIHFSVLGCQHYRRYFTSKNQTLNIIILKFY